MKKLAILMALILCISCTLLVACGGNEGNQETEPSTDSSTEVATDAPDTGDTDEPDETDDGTVETDDGTVETDDAGDEDEEVEVGEIDSSKDAYADDIYNGTTPEVIG